LATLEATFSELQTNVGEIKVDVKILVAAQNRQTGAAKLAAVIWSGLLALGGAIGGAFVAKAH
ncbi:MAG TPA: hypothetical protein VHP13_07415, partial [Gammaproteobacteria bacterium]|nr:hypothetical protein [Gammaproteobacteria bacterium]